MSSYTAAAAARRHTQITEKTINIANYPQTHYITYADGTAPTKIFDTVQSSYKGNYKSSYNPDYLDITKQNFVNNRGYSSNTQYLVWANLATQKVNVFQGSKGKWKLIKVFRCASGARATPTPQGVTYVTYKQTKWKTDSYVCKPIVRFYPNTGYAFHSVLYKPDESGIKDGSIGFPGITRLPQDEAVKHPVDLRQHPDKDDRRDLLTGSFEDQKQLICLYYLCCDLEKSSSVL